MRHVVYMSDAKRVFKRLSHGCVGFIDRANRQVQYYEINLNNFGLPGVDFDGLAFGFVVVAVDGGDDVAVFAEGGGNVAFRVTGDADDAGGVVEVHAFTGGEAVDDEVLRVAGVLPVATGHPAQGVSLAGAFLLEIAYFPGGGVVQASVGRDEGRGLMIVLAEAVGKSAGVEQNLVGGPEAVAAHVTGLSGGGHLAGEVAGVHGALDVLPDVEMCFPGVLVPPVKKGEVVGSLVTDFPVYLGCTVINPSLACPEGNVGVEVVVILESVGTAAVRVAGLVAVYAEWADAEADPGFLVLDGFLEGTYQLVHVLSPPVVPLVGFVSGGEAVFPETVVVREGFSIHGVGIKVVIHVYGIDVIPAHDVPHDTADVFPAGGDTRVEEQLPPVGDEPLGMLVIDVGVGQVGRSARSRAEGVQPGVKFHVAPVAFPDEEFHGIPVGFGGHALFSGEEAAPGFYPGGIPGIGLGTHLEDDGVDAAGLEKVEFTDEVGFHFLGSHGGVFTLENGLNPCPAEFPFGVFLREGSRAEHEGYD